MYIILDRGQGYMLQGAFIDDIDDVGGWKQLSLW